MSEPGSTPSDVAAGPGGGPPPAAATSAAAVLVVDDVEDNRELLCRGIRKQGHDVTTAEDGRRALELLAERHFDLVLLDIMMPSVNGYDVLAAMKADPTLRHIPVIVVSAVGEQDSVVRCIELGAEDYLLKPFNAVLLRARISASLEKKRLRDREREVLALLRTEQERSERLLLSIFPRAIAERLKAGEASVAESYPDATVLLADVSNFNELAAGRRPTEVVGLLDRIFSAFDRLAERYGVEKVKTIGDAYMLAGGVPQPRPDHADAVADMALAMQQEIVRLNTGLREPFSLRIGIAAGPVVAGVIGTTKFAFDVWGQTGGRGGSDGGVRLGRRNPGHGGRLPPAPRPVPVRGTRLVLRRGNWRDRNLSAEGQAAEDAVSSPARSTIT